MDQTGSSYYRSIVRWCDIFSRPVEPESSRALPHGWDYRKIRGAKVGVTITPRLMPLHLTVLQSDLMRELTLAHGSVEKKHIMQPVFRHILITASGSRVTIATTDDTLSYQGSLPGKVTEPGSVAVLAEKIIGWAKDFEPDAEIGITIQKNGWVRVSCGRNNSTIPALPGADFPGLVPVGPVTADIPSDLFIEGLQRQRIAIGSDPVKTWTNNVLIELHPSVGFRLVSTNIHTMAVTDEAFDMQTCPEVKTTLQIHEKAVAELVRLIPLIAGDERIPVTIHLQDNYVHFGIRDCYFGTRMNSFEYPDYARVFPERIDHRVLLPAASLRQALSRVDLFANDSHAVDLTFGGDGLCIVATSSESGTGEESIDFEYSGQPVTMRVNAAYLGAFLKKAGVEPIEILFINNPKISIEWRIADDPTFRFVVALMALPKQEEDDEE